MTLAGWPDVAYEDQSAEGKCRLGYVIGMKGPCRILPWTSKATWEIVKSSMGGGVFRTQRNGGSHAVVEGFFICPLWA